MAELSDVVKRLDAITGVLVFLLPEPLERRSLRDQIRLFDEAGLASVGNREDRGQTAASSHLGTRQDSRQESQEASD
jgi:hypothetical protein